MAVNEEIPRDVMKVWAIQHSKCPIGIDMYQMCKEVIEKHPKFFPWETLYNSIPESVHTAYAKEKYGDFEEILKIPPNPKGGGFTQMIEESMKSAEENLIKRQEEMKGKTLADLIKEVYEIQAAQREKEDKRKKEDKALWDKHYKKYGLKYND